jgi:Fuc2NAc and GlcNAc transferase
VIGGFFYPKLAIRCSAIAVPNTRSLHVKITPRGGGIIIAISTLLGLLVLSIFQIINFYQYLPILIGGVIVSVIGFADDCFELSAKLRLLMQFGIATGLCILFAGKDTLNVGFVIVTIGWFKFPLTIFLLCWFYNLFNFIDGSDGMASSAVVYITILFSIMAFIEHQPTSLLIMMLLGSATISFLIFNWPPAKIFLGDAGTNFCAYMISIVAMLNIWQDGFNVWVWVNALGFYISDTTFTTLIRIVKFPRTWYQPHRSHAYQNLVYSFGHLKVLLLVWIFNLLWFLPFALLAYFFPRYSLLFFVISYGVISPFILKYGPLFKMS